MRIGIDARFFGPQGTGLGRYIEELVKELQNIDEANEYFILLQKDNYHLFNPSRPNFKKVLVEARPYSLREQVVMPMTIKKLRVDLMHFGHFNVPIFYQGRFVVTIHDLIKHQFRGLAATTRSPLVYWIKHLGYRLVMRQAIRKSLKIIVPSEWVKKEILNNYRVAEDKISVTYEAGDKNFAKENPGQDEEAILLKYRLKTPFLIYVGNTYPYKNLTRLIQALGIIRKEDGFKDLKLAVACSRNVFLERLEVEVKKEGLSEGVVLTGYVPDQDLVTLYKKAELYVFPSLAEGFGIPALEAMMAGLPVAAADASCLPEVLGEAALYFDPYNVHDIVKVIKKVLSDHDLRLRLKQKGLVKSNEYSWQDLAQKTLAIYQGLARK